MIIVDVNRAHVCCDCGKKIPIGAAHYKNSAKGSDLHYGTTRWHLHCDPNTTTQDEQNRLQSPLA